MRRLLISISILAFSLSSLIAQDLDKILSDHYKASAQEKMVKIKTMITKGKITYAAMGMESEFTLYQARPAKLRVEADFQGSQIIQTFNGTTGWMYAPAMGIAQPQEMGSAELKSIMSQTEFESPLWDYKNKGNELELLGSSDDGKAHKVRMLTSEGDEMTICISKETSLISGILSTQNVGGGTAEVNVEMKDYKNIKGIPTPHYIATKMDGQLAQTFVIESIEMDKKLEASMFEKPVAE